jgi:hypothetical protein
MEQVLWKGSSAPQRIVEKVINSFCREISLPQPLDISGVS